MAQRPVRLEQYTAVLNTAGLRLEQAPPIHVPLRFFLTAPVFLFVAAALLGWQGEAILASRWSPAALAVTHLIVIGFLGQTMCGALLQMLPVIAGSPVPAVKAVGVTVNLFLAAGAGLLGWGFLGGGQGILTVGAVCAALGFLTFLVAAGLALTRAKGAPQTIRAIRLAFASLLVTVVVGLLLTGGLSSWIAIPRLMVLVDVHLAWGLLGWVGLLVMGVAFQIVPMFYVTPPYPEWLSRWAAPIVVAALALSSLLALNAVELATVATTAVAVIAYALFAAVSFWVQMRRQRKRIDATLLHWWLAMACVVAAGINWAVSGPPVLLGILVLFGLGVGLPSGMLLKIVPFLTWFHLQHLQLASGKLGARVPHMLTFLPDRWARLQFASHLLALIGLIGAWMAPDFSRVAAVALGLPAVSLGGLVVVSRIRFRRIASALESPQV